MLYEVVLFSNWFLFTVTRHKKDILDDRNISKKLQIQELKMFSNSLKSPTCCKQSCQQFILSQYSVLQQKQSSTICFQPQSATREKEKCLSFKLFWKPKASKVGARPHPPRGHSVTAERAFVTPSSLLISALLCEPQDFRSENPKFLKPTLRALKHLPN